MKHDHLERANPLDPAHKVTIGLGMAAGHLKQVRTGQMVPNRYPQSLRWSAHPLNAVLRLEHLQAACGWLQLAAIYKVPD